MSGRRRYVPDWPERLGGTRRRLGRVMLFLGIAILVVVVLVGRLKPLGSTAPSATTASSPPAAAGSVTTLEHRGNGWYLANPEAWPVVSVVHIVDGDTLDVRAGGTTLRIRLFGVDTPEVGQPCATDATGRLGALAGSLVRLVADVRQQDQYGRELRYVFMPDGRSIDATLLDEGLAHAWREDGALRPTLVGIENAAHAAHRGCLWKG